MTLFAGARTHSTIAALSTGVPTLSFAYSIKARGINRDIFGNTDYCLEPKDLGAEMVSCRISSMLDKNVGIHRYLIEQMPRFQKAALNAGAELKTTYRRELICLNFHTSCCYCSLSKHPHRSDPEHSLYPLFQDFEIFITNGSSNMNLSGNNIILVQ